jgi:hypothetical protein
MYLPGRILYNEKEYALEQLKKAPEAAPSLLLN